MAEATDPFAELLAKGPYRTILIDPPWRFKNRTGKIAPEHKRLHRYQTLSVDQIAETVPVPKLAAPSCHLYMWCPNALLPSGLDLIRRWGFCYKTNLIWCKIIERTNKPDRRGVGFYYRNVTEMVLFAIKGKERTRGRARSQENFFAVQKQEHSRKPAILRKIIEECSYAPYLELFAREQLPGWTCWGNEADTYAETRKVYPTYRVNGHLA